MSGKGFVVPAGGGAVPNMAPGRYAALKLVGGETAVSVMLFEETAPPGTETTFHLHHESDEVLPDDAAAVLAQVNPQHAD